MVKRTASAQDEPDVNDYPKPSEKEHLFQVVDVLEDIDSNPDIVHAKLEVVGGEEEGRSILNRCNLDDQGKGFFATRFLLKAIGEEYKGDTFPIDTENWIGKQFYATVKHNDGYANIDQFNFDKKVEQADISSDTATGTEVAWDSD